MTNVDPGFARPGSTSTYPALQPVERPQLPFEVAQQRIGRQRLARHPLAELARLVPAPVRVQVGVEPFLQRAELAASELLVEITDLFADRLEQLRRVQVAQRVRREVTERRTGPVDVLQAAQRIVRDVHAEVLLVATVPLVRQIGG